MLLVSLKAASLGLNLTAANHVVLMDLWWNPSVEEQAIDRAHRIGQSRTVRVMRITIAGALSSMACMIVMSSTSKFGHIFVLGETALPSIAMQIL